MNSPAHSSTVFDPDIIAELRCAMDPERMFQVFRDGWRHSRMHEQTVDEVGLERVYPREANHFVLEYRLHLSGVDGKREQTVFAELAPGDPGKRKERIIKRLKKRRRGQIAENKWRDATVVDQLEGTRLVVRWPGFDERLLGLRFVHSPQEAADPLAGATGAEPLDITADVLSHRLGKRAIVRFQYHTVAGGTASVIAKLYKARSHRGRAVHEWTQQLRSTGFGSESTLRLPCPVAYLPEWNMVFMEDVPGVPLPELRGQALANGIARAGRILAKLHRSRPSVDQIFGVTDELALLERWIALVNEVDPSFGREIMSAYREVRALLTPYAHVSPVTSHRDFYEKQILIAETSATLIDLDTLCRADPALDLGNFIAHLKLITLQGFADAAGHEPLFLDGYAPDGQSEAISDRIRAYTKSSLLRLVCLYAFWPRWRHVPEGLLEAFHAL